MRTMMEMTRKSQTLSLKRGDLIGIPQRRGITNLGVREGRIWATRDCDPQDFVLDPGKSAHFRGRGLLLIEALSDAEITVRQVA